MFTVLFSDDENTKEDILLNILGDEKIVNTRNYTLIKENYERALFHLRNNIFYDFFKFRRPLRRYIKFKVSEDTRIEESTVNVENKVTIIIDCSVQSGNRKIELEECTVKDAKRIIFDRMGLSVSKQEICQNDEVLNNNRFLRNETVILRQKRRTNKK